MGTGRVWLQQSKLRVDMVRSHWKGVWRREYSRPVPSSHSVPATAFPRANPAGSWRARVWRFSLKRIQSWVERGLEEWVENNSYQAKLILLIARQASKLRDELLGQGIATLFRKPADREDGGLVSQRTIFPRLRLRPLLY